MTLASSWNQGLVCVVLQSDINRKQRSNSMFLCGACPAYTQAMHSNYFLFPSCNPREHFAIGSRFLPNTLRLLVKLMCTKPGCRFLKPNWWTAFFPVIVNNTYHRRVRSGCRCHTRCPRSCCRGTEASLRICTPCAERTSPFPLLRTRSIRLCKARTPCLFLKSLFNNQRGGKNFHLWHIFDHF